MPTAPLELLFVGSGVSCAIPVIGHVGTNSKCCCEDAAQSLSSRNRRNNVSLLFTLHTAPPGADEAEQEHGAVRVLIDAGKTFRNAYLRVLAPRRIRYVDALLVTHGHADAMNCVEDLCDVHTATMAWARTTGTPIPPCVELTPMFLTPATLKEVELVVSSSTLAPAQHLLSSPLLRDAKLEAPGKIADRARLQPILLPEDRPLRIPVEGLPHDFPVYSLPVEHGANYLSLGFVFGRGTSFKSQGGGKHPEGEEAGHSCVVYISDLTVIPDFSYAFLDDLVRIDVLVIDLLAEKGATSPAHTCWDDLWAIFHRLHPRRTYCIGMFCCIEHNEGNELWRADLERERAAVRAGLEANQWPDPSDTAWMEHFLETVESIELAYDGMELGLPS
eukprot:gene10180-7131_t